MADTALVQNQNYDLVLLDLGLPRKDGLDVLRAMAQGMSNAAVAANRTVRMRSQGDVSTSGVYYYNA